MRSRLAVFAVLLLLSVSTLIGTVTDPSNRFGYAVATTIFHVFLFASGYATARHWQAEREARQAREAANADALRRMSEWGT